MIIGNKKKNDTNKRQKCDKDSVKRKVDISINQVMSVESQVFVIGCVAVFAIWTKPFMTEYYQKLANSHFDSAQLFQMVPLFLVALFFSIHNFVKKRYFVGILTLIIAIWSFYWAFLAGPFYCHSCTYGG